MSIRSSAVGAHLPTQKVLITPQMTLAYAAGIGDQSAVCIDDLHSDFQAHPAFCTRLEWLLVSKSRALTLGLDDKEARRAVHAGQDTQFLLPLRAGREVSVQGLIVEVRSTRAGALVRTKIEIRDHDIGQPLTSTISTAVYRGVEVEGQDRSLGDAEREVSAEAPPLPESVHVNLAHGFTQIYSACADIWNPIHTEHRAARAAGLPGPIVHGTALWALAGSELIKRYAAGQPQGLKSLSGRFSAMVKVGEPITIRYGISDRPGAVAFNVLNSSGEAAVSRGLAEFVH